MKAMLLSEEDRELVEVELLGTRIQRMIREELDRGKKKPPAHEKERLPCFYVKGKDHLKRVFKWQVLFPDEDHLSWLHKIIDACKTRRFMDSMVRVNCYIDNMPVQDI